MQQAYDQFAQGQFEEAVETFSASIALQSQAVQALRGRGLAYVQLKRWALAAADFAAVQELAPDDADNGVDLGMSLAMDHKVYPAIDVFEAVLAKQPDCVRGHLELGLLHLRLGAIPKGRAHLQQALTCRPSLEQRRLIESIVREQDRLDRKRLYRPDFEALQQQRRNRAPSWLQRLWRRRSP